MIKKILLLSVMSIISYENSSACLVVYEDNERRSIITCRSDYDNSIELFKRRAEIASKDKTDENILKAQSCLKDAYNFMSDKIKDKNQPNIFNDDDIKEMFRHCMTLYILHKGNNTFKADDWLRMAITRAEILKPITYEMKEELYGECKYLSQIYHNLSLKAENPLVLNWSNTKHKCWADDTERYRYKGYCETFTNAVTPIAAFAWANQTVIIQGVKYFYNLYQSNDINPPIVNIPIATEIATETAINMNNAIISAPEFKNPLIPDKIDIPSLSTPTNIFSPKPVVVYEERDPIRTALSVGGAIAGWTIGAPALLPGTAIILGYETYKFLTKK